MADAIPPLPPGFKLDPIPELPPGFKLDPVGEKPKTPEETKQILQGRYGDILKRNTDPSKLGITKSVLKGTGKQLGRDVFDTGKMALDLSIGQNPFRPDTSGLTEKVHGATELYGESEEAGGIIAKGAEMLPIGTGAGKGLNAAKAAIKLPTKVNPALQHMAERGIAAMIPGSGTVIKAVKGFKAMFGVAVEDLSTMSQRQLAFKLYEEAHGIKPRSIAEGEKVVQEFRAFQGKVKPPLLPKPLKPPPPSKGTAVKYGGAATEADKGIGAARGGKPTRQGINRAMEPDKPGELLEGRMFPENKVKPTLRRKGVTEKVTAKTAARPTDAVKTGSGFDTGSEPTTTSIKHEARHTDAMRAVFANARNLGVDSKALRAAAKEFYGKGISEMTYEEVVDLNERLLMNKAVPKK